MRKKHPRVFRYRVFFYERGSSSPDQYGEVSETYTAITSGFFAKEKARRPMEIADGSATVSEIQYVLIGAYVKKYFTDLRSEMIAWCPQTDQVFELVGEPIDNEGNNREVMIYVADNIRRSIDTSTLPTEFTN